MTLRYKKHLDECGLLTSEVLISPPDTREGHEDTDVENLPEVQRFWERMMTRFRKEQDYKREILGDFGRTDGADLLIVVDKLLVGFDEPLNTVLYIDKPLKDHAILQAIARVNRLYEGKEYGYVIDYRGILGLLNEAIETYDALAEFDPDDLEGTIKDVAKVIEKLPHYHSDLWAVFRGVNTGDSEAMERFLAPEDQRQVFYDGLTTYACTFKVALSTVSFYETTPEKRIQTYKRDLIFFHNLRMLVKLRYADTVDFRDYEQKIRKLLDDHIDAQGVKQLTSEVEIFDTGQFDELIAGLSTPRARAGAILNHLKRTAIEKMETDPAYYREFSQLIEETLQAIEEERINELEALEFAKNLREQESSGYRKGIPHNCGNCVTRLPITAWSAKPCLKVAFQMMFRPRWPSGSKRCSSNIKSAIGWTTEMCSTACATQSKTTYTKSEMPRKSGSGVWNWMRLSSRASTLPGSAHDVPNHRPHPALRQHNHRVPTHLQGGVRSWRFTCILIPVSPWKPR